MCKSFLHKSPSETRIDFYSIVYAKRVDKDHTVRKSKNKFYKETMDLYKARMNLIQFTF